MCVLFVFEPDTIAIEESFLKKGRRKKNENGDGGCQPEVFVVFAPIIEFADLFGYFDLLIQQFSVDGIARLNAKKIAKQMKGEQQGFFKPFYR